MSLGKWISLPGALLALVTLLLPWAQLSCGPMHAQIQGYHFAKGSVNQAIQLAFQGMAQAMQTSMQGAMQPAATQPAPAAPPPAPVGSEPSLGAQPTATAAPVAPPQPPIAEPPAEPQQTLASERLGFRIRFPEYWRVERQIYEDKIPDNVEEFLQQGGKLELGGVRAPTGEDDWNALTFNQGTDDPAERPIIGLYAIEREPRTFEQYSRDLKAFVEHSQGQLVSAKEFALPSGLQGYDFIYQLVSRTRHTVFFRNGKRYGLTYSELAPGAAERADPVFEALLASFQIISKGEPAAVAQPAPAPGPRPTAAAPQPRVTAKPATPPPTTPVQPPTPTLGQPTMTPSSSIPAFQGPNLFVLAWAGLLLLGTGLLFPAGARIQRLALALYALGTLALGGFAVSVHLDVQRELQKSGQLAVVSFEWLWGYWLAVLLTLVAVAGGIVNIVKGAPPAAEPVAFSDLTAGSD